MAELKELRQKATSTDARVWCRSATQTLPRRLSSPVDLRGLTPPAHQAGKVKWSYDSGWRGGPARVTTRGRRHARPGKCWSRYWPTSRCETGRRTRAGTRAARSHRPRSHEASPQTAARPPSTKTTDRIQNRIILNPGFVVCGAVFRWFGFGYRG